MPHQHHVGPIGDTLEVVPCHLSTAFAGPALFCSIQSAIPVGQGNQADLAEVTFERWCAALNLSRATAENDHEVEIDGHIAKLCLC